MNKESDFERGPTMMKKSKRMIPMTATPSFRLRLAPLVLTLSILAQAVAAQSGRSWMNGFVFADSDTRGLAGATVELIGDQSNARLRSVKLTTKTEQDGKYSIQDIPYGEYTFKASAEGYVPYEIKLYVGSDMLTQIHVKLKKEK